MCRLSTGILLKKHVVDYCIVSLFICFSVYFRASLFVLSVNKNIQNVTEYFKSMVSVLGSQMWHYIHFIQLLNSSCPSAASLSWIWLHNTQTLSFLYWLLDSFAYTVSPSSWIVFNFYSLAKTISAVFSTLGVLTCIFWSAVTSRGPPPGTFSKSGDWPSEGYKLYRGTKQNCSSETFFIEKVGLHYNRIIQEDASVEEWDYITNTCYPLLYIFIELSQHSVSTYIIWFLALFSI